MAPGERVARGEAKVRVARARRVVRREPRVKILIFLVWLLRWGLVVWIRCWNWAV